MFVDVQWILLKMGVLVHPQLSLLCGAALPGALFSLKNMTFQNKHVFFRIFELLFVEMDLISY